MRRAIAREYGAELEVVEVDLPTPGPGQVAIAVRAAGVNPSDAKLVAGEFGRNEANLPLKPGSEIAGVVIAVGDDVDEVAVDDEVVAYRVSGGFSEVVVTKSSNVFPKPALMSFAQASGLLLTGATAIHLLEATGVNAGDRVIVHGASGSVGIAAVQLAVARGASVVGTSSSHNFDLLRQFGATPIAYGPGLVDRLRQALPDGADVALDTVGTAEALDASVELVTDRGRIATINGFAHGAELGVLLLGGGPGADPGSAIRNAARQTLVEAADRGEITVLVAREFPLDDVEEAVRFANSGHPGGKVVVVPASVVTGARGAE